MSEIFRLRASLRVFFLAAATFTAAVFLSASADAAWRKAESPLFVVYSDGRDTSRGSAALLNRTLAVKATRMLRF